MAKRKYSWMERYRLGVELNRGVGGACTFEEIAAELGITKQNAYTEVVLALGTFALLWREQFGSERFYG